MKPLLLHYYITNRCNSRCRFCSIWSESPKHDALPDDVFRNIAAAKKQGCRFVDFTGGEPLLHPNLPDFLVAAKKCGLTTSVTTNCLLFKKRVHELAGKIDLLHFSLDADNAPQHNDIRGSESFDAVVESIDSALNHHLVPDLLFTYTDYNIDAFEGVYTLARKKKIMVLLDPVFNTSGKDTVSPATHYKALAFSKRAGVYLNRAHLIVRQQGGNHQIDPLCRAVSSTIVISPDNTRLLPCFHHQMQAIAIGDVLPDFKQLAVKDAVQKQGRYAVCEGCHINCYFDPSYNYQYNCLFFQSLKSKFTYIIMKYLIYGHYKTFFHTKTAVEPPTQIS